MSDPAPELFADLWGQQAAVAELRGAARHPVHAYLFHGSGPTTRRAARAFAAALLCPTGGCGRCAHCRRALAGTHPDLVTVERTGAALEVDEARRLVGLAQRRPLEADRQVLVVADVHLAERSAPALLKTVEEPPASTVFILLAESLPPELVTLVSRSVVVDFPPLPSAAVAAWLVDQGVDRELAALVAQGSGGDPDRALILSGDPGFARRYELWHSIPARLDGTGAVAAELARSLSEAAEASLEPLRAQHAAQLAAAEEEAAANRERGVPGRRELVDRQRREERRWRTDELRAGLGVLSRSYRDRMVDSLGRQGPAAAAETRGCQAAIDLITDVAASLLHNPNESMLLEGLLVRLGSLDG